MTDTRRVDTVTRPTTTDLAITDRCIRCSDRPTTAPEGKARTGTGSVVLTYICNLGHRWERSFTRGAIKRKTATAGRRHHLADRAVTAGTAGTTTGNTAPDHEDEANTTSKASRQPSPWTCWNPDRRLWTPR